MVVIDIIMEQYYSYMSRDVITWSLGMQPPKLVEYIPERGVTKLYGANASFQVA